MDQKLTEKQLHAFRFIKSCLVQKGKSPSVREVMKELHYGSPNSAAYVIESLINLGLLQRREDKRLQLTQDFEREVINERTVPVPLVGSVSCGTPVLAKENINAIIPVSEKLAKPPHRYFLLRAQGDSMNLTGIDDGDLVLIKQQQVANNGDVVVALIDDEATIKKFYTKKGMVILKPNSTNAVHQPIILTKDLQVQGVVVSSFPNID